VSSATDSTLTVWMIRHLASSKTSCLVLRIEFRSWYAFAMNPDVPIKKSTTLLFTMIRPRFAAMTWKERAAFMAKPENAVVRERYEKHLASAGAK